MVRKIYLAVVCATLLSVPYSASLVASGGSGTNKKTIIVHTDDSGSGSVVGQC